jgi:hypothetical protein
MIFSDEFKLLVAYEVDFSSYYGINEIDFDNSFFFLPRRVI